MIYIVFASVTMMTTTTTVDAGLDAVLIEVIHQMI